MFRSLTLDFKQRLFCSPGITKSCLQWCVQALPECGSFQTHVHKAIFPAIIEAKKEEDAGQPQSIAIAEAVPGLVRAMSKTMACKEMCEAAVMSCSCKTDGHAALTFGEAIENAEKAEEDFKEVLHPATESAFCSLRIRADGLCCMLAFTCSLL